MSNAEGLQAPRSKLRDAVVDGLLLETQVVPLDRATAERPADRIFESIELNELTAIDRARVAEWLAVARDELFPLPRLHGRGVGICDVRGYHSMVGVVPEGWAYDVLVCEDCEAATQVERGD